jgi:predicted DNA-binding transcriptional regulator AlpA
MLAKLLAFNDLRALGIAASRPQLRKLVTFYGFPPGIQLGPNSRRWPQDAVEEWLAARPAAGRRRNTSELRGAALLVRQGRFKPRLSKSRAKPRKKIAP